MVPSRVLVVEDEATTKALIQYKLKNSGFEVATVNDGTEALEFVAGHDVDLIILDLMMPLMSGNELLIELRRSGNRVPVIVLTARTLEKDIVEALSLGADDYVKKPFSPSELVARVRSLLGRVQRV
jgi:DNA-binding response OmpR family regulator